jgi:hypothetical protein
VIFITKHNISYLLINSKNDVSDNLRNNPFEIFHEQTFKTSL